ncbi:histone deacetylase family protein [Chitinophaga sancti]|uniref:histone deacetylase family protein n=1 Tax=Chitinophaga sancti TaxID=1004 RepID=UPI003F7AE478
MLIAYDPIFAHPLPEGHRFPMAKYELIPEQLLREGVVKEDMFHKPQPVSEETILLTHTPEYWNKLKNLQLSEKEVRRIGLPQSAALVMRERVICQGTIDCALYALENGSIGLNVAGGTHHAFTDRGEGFCLMNDFAIAANYLLHHQLVRNVMIIDLDVHQGNGTAAIFEEHEKVFTFSMHGEHNYPFHKETSAWDIGLPDGTTDDEYLNKLASCLAFLMVRKRPEFIFYLSGVDILSTDRYGRMKVTEEGCRCRDVLVLNNIKRYGIPCAVAMGGGYSPQLRHIVNAHCNTFKTAAAIF